MKIMKFRQKLIPLILSGTKTTTWRLFDDKNLHIGDELSLINWETGEKFAEAEIISVVEKRISELSEEEKLGHEKYQTDQEMYREFSIYYKQPVGKDTMAKVIRFKLK